MLGKLIDDLFDFSSPNGGVKAVLVFFIFLGIGMFVWDLLGLDSGSGGTPYSLEEIEYYESLE